MHNVAYYSNFVYCAFGRPYGLVVGLEGAPVTLSALIDGGQPWRRGYGDNLVYTDWARDNFITGVRDLVRSTGGGQAGVGVECDHINLDLYRSISCFIPFPMSKSMCESHCVISDCKENCSLP